MLVLSRKPGESVVIGLDIRITILEVRGNRVRVGVAAPTDVPISRTELNEFWVESQDDVPSRAKIQADNQHAGRVIQDRPNSTERISG